MAWAESVQSLLPILHCLACSTLLSCKELYITLQRLLSADTMCGDGHKVPHGHAIGCSRPPAMLAGGGNVVFCSGGDTAAQRAVGTGTSNSPPGFSSGNPSLVGT